MPLNVLDNPFPTGLLAPIGSSLGLLTNVGGQVDFIDQNKGNPKVHQYSADIERELGGAMAVTIGYIGATGRDIGFCGTNDCSININQIDPNLARQLYPAANGGWDAAKLLESVPNPFFGIAAAGEFGTRATIARGQLLRPFPEFGDVLHARVDRGLQASVQRGFVPAGQADERAYELAGRPLQLHVERFEGQPVGREQHLRVAHEFSAEQLRPERRVLDQHLQLAAPDRPGADRPDTEPGRSRQPEIRSWRADGTRRRSWSS